MDRKNLGRMGISYVGNWFMTFMTFVFFPLTYKVGVQKNLLKVTVL